MLRGTDLGDITVLSVHAQPARADESYLAAYPQREDLVARSGGNDRRDGGHLFDADVVLKTIERRGPGVLACGDLNEARGWDGVHDGHTWGAEYFGRPGPHGLVDGRVQQAGLLWVGLGEGTEEVVTRSALGHPSLQLDHVIAGPEVASRITSPRVDGVAQERRISDHAPIWFDLDL